MLAAAHVIPHARWDLLATDMQKSVKEARSKQLLATSPRIHKRIDINTPENGLLLRQDLHIAFDRFFWSIHPTQLRVVVFVHIPYLLPFHGRLLFPDGHRVPAFFPTEKILRWHWQQCVLRRLKAFSEHPEGKYYPEGDVDLCVECGIDDTECVHAVDRDIRGEEDHQPATADTPATISASDSTRRSRNRTARSRNRTDRPSNSTGRSSSDASNALRITHVDRPNEPKWGTTTLCIGDTAPQQEAVSKADIHAWISGTTESGGGGAIPEMKEQHGASIA